MRTPLKQALAGVVFSAAVGMVPTANALQYNFDFNSTTVNFDLVLNVDTDNGVCPSGCLITAVTGTSGARAQALKDERCENESAENILDECNADRCGST